MAVDVDRLAGARTSAVGKSSAFDFEPGRSALSRIARTAMVAATARPVGDRPLRFFTDSFGYIDRQILIDGAFEQAVLQHLRQTAVSFGCTDLLIDIGANIGNHTVHLAPTFTNVVAVEPHPALFRVLEANVIRNGILNVECTNVALGERAGRANLLEYPGNHGLSKLEHSDSVDAAEFGLTADQFTSRYEVEVVEASGFVAAFADRLDRALIKIDVEGLECEILESLRELLVAHRPIVAFEWFPDRNPELVPLLRSLEEHYELAGSYYEFPTGAVGKALHYLRKGRELFLDHLDLAAPRPYYPLAFLLPRARSNR